MSINYNIRMKPGDGKTRGRGGPARNRERDPDPGLDRKPGRWRVPLVMCAIFLAVLLAYIPAMQCGFVWDDDFHVTQNQTLRTVDGLRRIWLEIGATPQYYPLVHTTFWIEYHLWGHNPFGYHLVNVLLHGLAALLVGLALRRLCVPGAYLAAALFALHPVQVESVAWITERKNVLSGVFYLSALLAYIRFAGLEADRRAAAHAERSYAICLLFDVCALFSKTVTCSLPGAILLLIWWKRGRLTRRDVLPVVPMFVIGAILGSITVWMETHHVGAKYVEWNLSLIDRCLVAGRGLCFYAGKLLLPSRLTFFYPRWHIDSAVAWQYLYPAAVLGVILALWLLRRRTGRSALVAVLFFCGTLMPALGFVNVYPMQFSFVADHFQYLASLGMIVLFAALLTGRNRGSRRRLRRPPGTTQRSVTWGFLRRLSAATILCVLASLTWRQGRIYEDLETLWRHTLANNPSAWLAQYNLGNLLARRGETEEAIDRYRKAIRLRPAYPEAHHNLGLTLMSQGKVDEALACYAQTLRLQPEHAGAHNSLGIALLAQGRIDEAIERFRRTLQIKPEYPEALLNLGIAMERMGKRDEAIGYYREAVTLDAEFVPARFNLAVMMKARGKLKEAAAQFNAVLRVKPDFVEARANLADILASRGQVDLAIAEYNMALRQRPDAAQLHNDLATLLGGQGRYEEAVAHLSRALLIDPEYATAHANLGLALIGQGKVKQAVEEFRAALRIDPNRPGVLARLADALRKLGKLDEAVQAYRQVVRKTPGDPDAYCNLGDALIRLGRIDEALGAYRAALELDDRHERAQGALSVLLKKRAAP